jgi:hypothetical protein
LLKEIRFFSDFMVSVQAFDGIIIFAIDCQDAMLKKAEVFVMITSRRPHLTSQSCSMTQTFLWFSARGSPCVSVVRKPLL